MSKTRFDRRTFVRGVGGAALATGLASTPLLAREPSTSVASRSPASKPIEEYLLDTAGSDIPQEALAFVRDEIDA